MQVPVCPPLWDGASCVPPTPALGLATFPCMTVFRDQRYDVTREYKQQPAQIPLSYSFDKIKMSTLIQAITI